MFVEDCAFCVKFSGTRTWLNDIFREEDPPDQVLIRRNGVISQVGVGALSVGYMLILPEKHYYSIGEAPKEVIGEVSAQMEDLLSILTDRFGSAICFEHGAVSYLSRGGACVDHAHMHVIPGCPGFRETVARDFEEQHLGNLADLRSFTDRKQPYLFVQDIDRQCFAYGLPGRIQSQYLRRVWAESLQRPDEWDWALYPNFEGMQATIELINTGLSNRSNHAWADLPTVNMLQRAATSSIGDVTSLHCGECNND